MRHLVEAAARTRDPLSWVLNLLFGWFFRAFQQGLHAVHRRIPRVVGKLLRVSVLVLLVYGGLLYLTVWSFRQMPTGFIPDQDQGYSLWSCSFPTRPRWSAPKR